MDFSSKHWAAFPRRFPSPATVLSLDFHLAKDHWVDRTFDTCNFSFILKGEGEFHYGGRVWKVRAPFVITQWPGEPVRYGPPLPDTWDELYLIYEARALKYFRRSGLAAASRPAWPIDSLPAVLAQVKELRALTNSLQPELLADRVDRVCERLILESLLPHSSGETIHDPAIRAIVERLRSEPAAPYDFELLAAQHGMSISTLRRRWFEELDEPPGRYLLNLRIQQSRRLLVETDLQVGEIAAETGFDDPLYFSRRFKIEVGMTALEYRNRFRLEEAR